MEPKMPRLDSWDAILNDRLPRPARVRRVELGEGLVACTGPIIPTSHLISKIDNLLIVPVFYKSWYSIPSSVFPSAPLRMS
jgi:hypothetical protein